MSVTAMRAAPKLPPHSIEAEQCVLGGLMIQGGCVPDVVAQVRERITAADFYRQDHQLIFEGLLALDARRQPADFITVSAHFQATGRLEDVGGMVYLGSLANDTPSAANVLAYAGVVRERAVLRRLIAAGNAIAELGYAADERSIEQRVNAAQELVSGLADVHARTEAPSMPEAIAEWTQYLERRMKGETDAVSTGLPDLDNVLGGGLERGDMVVVAGRPSMGKTALGMGMLVHAARQGAAGLVISMEMPRVQLLSRAISRASRVDGMKLRTGRLNELEFESAVNAAGAMTGLPILIEHGSALTAHDMLAMARRAKRRLPGLRLVLVDYMQLGASDRERDNRNLQVAEISAAMKAIAIEHGVTVLALSQLSREADGRRPQMSHLRDSGAIEQDADVLMFPYRPDHHKAKEAGQSHAEVEIAEIIVGKQRNGPTDSVKVAFHTRFSSYESLQADADYQDLPPSRSSRRALGA